MRDTMVCGATQERMAALLAGGASMRERLEVESHAASCARCANAYRDLVAVSVRLDRAYAPLRSASAALSPARVRLALRAPAAPAPVAAPVRVTRLAARVNEVALAAAVTAFAFIGAGSVSSTPALVDEAATPDVVVPTANPSLAADDASFLRWFRLGRYASPSDLLDPAVSPRSLADDAPPITIERAGLVR